MTDKSCETSDVSNPASEVAALKKEIEKLRMEMEQLKAFRQVTEYPPYEFPFPFVAKAVEVEGLHDGVDYIVQGLGSDGEWKNLFAQQYQSNEIGYHQFQNEIAYKSYRLVCQSDIPLNRPKLFVYELSDDPKLFKKGIPTLEAPCAVQGGYELSTSSYYAPDLGRYCRYINYHVLDDDVKTAYASAQKAIPAWIQIKLPRPRIFNAVEIAHRGDETYALSEAMKEFQIEGSSDKEHWKLLLQGETNPWSLGERRVFFFSKRTRIFVLSSCC